MNRKWIHKCTSKKTEQFRIICMEQNQIMFDPDVMYGVSEHSNSKKCAIGANDCHGMSASLNDDLSKCFWQKECHISLSGNEPILNVIGSNSSDMCKGQHPDYVLINNPRCVDSGNTFINFGMPHPKAEMLIHVCVLLLFNA